MATEARLVEAAVYAALAVVVFLLSERVLRSVSRWPYAARLFSGIRWAVTAVLVGYALGSVIAAMQSALPSELALYVSPENARFVALLVGLMIGVRAVVGAVAVEVAARAGLQGLGRLTNAGVYLLGVLLGAQLFLRSHLAPSVGEFEWRVVNLISGVLVVYVVAAAVDLVLHHVISSAEGDRSFLTAITFLRRAVVVFLGILGIVAVLLVTFPEAIGIAASSLIAAGFASIVIGLAAQSTLSNLISGLMIAVTRPFRIGDAVMFRNEFCFVEDIRLFHSVLRTWDNRRLVAPNAIFQNEVIANYSIVDPTMLVPVFVDVSYESDLDKAMAIMKELAEKHPLALPTPGLPAVHVMELGESGVRLRLLVRAKDQATAFELSKELLYQIKQEFQRQGIEISYPRRYVILADRRSRKGPNRSGSRGSQAAR
ncbi:MAG: mechanosensitive ion channel family protein [Nitrososphaerota archaeon]